MMDAPGAVPLFDPHDHMGQVMAAHDWSESPAGPPESWPALLQAMVRILVTSRFSMWMGWGPELTFFYNEAYARDTLAAKHPSALGRPAREVWSEIWADLEPRVAAVMSEGRATWDEALLLFVERSGYREETYHTFSYSPINDFDGRVVGLLCVVSEDTKRVIAERRMATLRDLAAAVSSARTEPEVFAAAGRCLAANARDLPFTLTYMFGEDGTAHLSSWSGTRPGRPAAPPVLPVADSGAVWPLASVVAGGGAEQIRLDGDGQWPTGDWDRPPDQAIVVPLCEGGQSAPSGVFIAGLNPYRAVDAEYRGFAELVASSIASGVASARAYESERRRAESLAELDRAKTEFFSNVSHEFRTPLTLIMAPADDALADDLNPLAEPQRTRMQVIQRNARRLRRLVNDMLDFARIEGGRLQAETVATDLVEYTNDIAGSFSPAIERSGLAFELALEPLERPVHVDRDMWEKIVLNLLSNALKFTLEGSIRLELQPRPDGVALLVSDTGIGIPEVHQGRLFERFYRAPRAAARSYEGTGIGLALVAELARLHGGSVSVDSREGVGSTFEVRVPYGAGPPSGGAQQRDSSRLAYLDEALQWVGTDQASGAAPPAGVPGGAGATSDATVLVVDDSPDMRAYLERLLAPYWRVQVAADGAEALAQIRSGRPDLVLTDVMMPRLDGFGLLREMRADPATETVPVVFLSARAGEEAAVEGLGAGADDYLVKPFSGLELLARVRSNLELAALRNRDAAWRRALVDSLEDAVVVLDQTGALVEANAAFERILGYPRTGVPYRPPFPWLIDRDADREAWETATGTHRRVVAGESLNAVVALRHRLGHLIHVAVAANSVGDGDDRRSVVAFHDVTAALAASERDAALARLGIRLAEASDVRQVHEAGLSELCRVFRARRAAVVTDEAGTAEEQAYAGDGPGPGPDDIAAALGRLGTEAVLATTADPPVADRPGADGRPAALVARLDPRHEGRAVWMDLGSGRPVTPDERSLFSVLCAYFGQAVRRAQLFDDSRRVATALQRAILGPTAVPPSIAVRYLPAISPLEVGGDWYDVVELDDGRLAVVVGDCTGRGLEAAATMGQLRSACRSLLLQAKGPSEVISALDVFAERLPAALCTTVFCAVIEPGSGSLRYSSAGHLPALLAGPDGSTVILNGGRSVPLGYLASVQRPEAAVVVGPGRVLVLYTDGLVERRGESLDEGIGRLAKALGERVELDPEPLADGLLHALVPSGDHEDDIALVVYAPPRPDRSRLDLRLHADAAELSAVRRRIREWLAAAGVAQDQANDVLIAAGEALANAIEHAYGFDRAGVIDLVGEVSDGEIKLRVADHGTWREGSSTENRGRGLEILRALADDLSVERGAEGTSVRIVKRVRR